MEEVGSADQNDINSPRVLSYQSRVSKQNVPNGIVCLGSGVHRRPDVRQEGAGAAGRGIALARPIPEEPPYRRFRRGAVVEHHG